MSEFEIKDLGEGRFELSGAMSFGTAAQILRESDRLFARHDSLSIDFAGVDDADSAGLALLLEWRSRARRDGTEVHYSGLPQSILSIARTTEVDHLL